MPMWAWILANICSGNGLLPDSTNPLLPEPMLTSHQCDSCSFHLRINSHKVLKPSPDSVRLGSPWSTINEKVRGPVQQSGRPMELLHMIMFEILKSHQNCILGQVSMAKELTKILFGNNTLKIKATSANGPRIQLCIVF